MSSPAGSLRKGKTDTTEPTSPSAQKMSDSLLVETGGALDDDFSEQSSAMQVTAASSTQNVSLSLLR